ncbi:unnamed protein product [Urochloa humidicola]
MLKVCKARQVGQSVALLQAFWRVPIAPPYVDDRRAHFQSLGDKLAEAGKTEACFRKGLRIVFEENPASLGAPLDPLESAANGGHNVAAYTLAMCLYRRNGGAADDEKVMAWLRKIEGDEMEAGATVGSRGLRWKNDVCMDLSWQAVDVIHWRRFSDAIEVAKPVVRGEFHDGGPSCKKQRTGWNPTGSYTFCSEQCRIRHECEGFFSRLV